MVFKHLSNKQNAINKSLQIHAIYRILIVISKKTIENYFLAFNNDFHDTFWQTIGR
jgi:hypothetical protein